MNNFAGVPPGCPIKIELWRNKSKVLIDSPDAAVDAEIIIENCHLHIPVGALDMSIFNDYEMSLRKHVARIRFRRWVVRTESIPLQTQNYESTLLYNPSDFPCRIIIGREK